MSVDKVELYINNFLIKNIKSFSIRSDIFTGAADFTASVDPAYIFPLASQPISYEWRINGEPVQKGFLDKCTKSYSKDNFTQEITGRDLCAILIDNSILYPTTYTSDPAYVTWLKQSENVDNKEIIRYRKHWTVEDIIRHVWENNHSINEIKEALDTDTDAAKIKKGQYYKTTKVNPPLSLWPLDFKFTAAAKKVSDAINQKLTKTSYGQSLFDVFTGLLSPLGLIIYHDPVSNQIIIQSVNNSSAKPVSYTMTGDVDDSPVYSITNRPPDNEYNGQADMLPFNITRQGYNNVISCDYSEDIQAFYRYIKVIGQTESGFDWSGNVQKSFQDVERISTNFKGLFKMKAADVNNIDAAVWNKTKTQLVDNQFLQQNRKLYSLKYKIHGFSSTNNRPWQLNHLCRVWDQYVPMQGVDFLAYSREFSGSKDNGYVTVLGLALPNLAAPFIEQTYNKAIPGQTTLASRTLFGNVIISTRRP